jgi:hypothetical protein
MRYFWRFRPGRAGFLALRFTISRMLRRSNEKITPSLFPSAFTRFKVGGKTGIEGSRFTFYLPRGVGTVVATLISLCSENTVRENDRCFKTASCAESFSVDYPKVVDHRKQTEFLTEDGFRGSACATRRGSGLKLAPWPTMIPRYYGRVQGGEAGARSQASKISLTDFISISSE